MGMESEGAVGRRGPLLDAHRPRRQRQLGRHPGMAPVPLPQWRGEREGENAKRPLDSLNYSQTSPAATFKHLNKAPGYFLKSQRNSYKLEITFRIITKIGEAK